jgi:hypothetical protein
MYVLKDLLLIVEEPSQSNPDFSYKEVSEISDMTEESMPEGLMMKPEAKDLDDFEKLN